MPAASRLPPSSPTTSLLAAAKFAACCTKRIITVTIKYYLRTDGLWVRIPFGTYFFQHFFEVRHKIGFRVRVRPRVRISDLLAYITYFTVTVIICFVQRSLSGCVGSVLAGGSVRRQAPGKHCFLGFLLFQSTYAITQTRHVCHSQVLTSARLRTSNNLL